MVIFSYFSFTSLSTVGFGDYHPVNNPERIFIALSILIGVIVFSLILQNFMQMINQMRTIHKDFDDSEKL
jgi:hypothetical protein